MLQDLVRQAGYKPGWVFHLHSGATYASGSSCPPTVRYRPDEVSTAGATPVLLPPLTLVICAAVDDSGGSGRISVEHPFAVPVSEPGCGWLRWLFDRVLDVERHEACEAFTVTGDRPFYPAHGPGADLYTVRQAS